MVREKFVNICNKLIKKSQFSFSRNFIKIQSVVKRMVTMFNLKLFRTLKRALDSKADLLTFSSMQKSANDDFIESLSSNGLKIKADEQRLEAMVRQQLKEEFPNIEKSPSYDLLVDAVIHNYKSKQLQAIDDMEGIVE